MTVNLIMILPEFMLVKHLVEEAMRNPLVEARVESSRASLPTLTVKHISYAIPAIATLQYDPLGKHAYCRTSLLAVQSDLVHNTEELTARR